MRHESPSTSAAATASWGLLPGATAGDIVRAMGEEGSLLLITGGLSIIFLVVTLVLIRSIFPPGRLRPMGMDPDVPLPRLRRTPDLEWTAQPRAAGAPIEPDPAETKRGRSLVPWRVSNLDEIFAVMVRECSVEPRILRHDERSTVVRLYHQSRPSRRPPCGKEQGLLEQGLHRLYERDVTIRHLACVATGDPVCELEVRHA